MSRPLYFIFKHLLQYQSYNKMLVNSSFFKKQFDLSKAELIGEGNFAQVYRIFDPESQIYLAIRRVDRDLGESDDIEKQKTINEELRRVENQHILKIYDIIESETCIWYITQYCEGGSLWDALNNCVDNKMNQKDALEVIYQISKGVKQLHNHRITHRDLKPQNILLKTKYVASKPIPVIKIADFGLSTKKIIMQTIAGTKQYIAPEQARFHNYTNAVDVWSLGIIFDQILHGSPYFVGDNNKEVFQKILKNPYKIRDDTIRLSIQQFLLGVLKKKAYERPIIAVICQNIQRILDEIKKQREQKQEVKQKNMNFQKKSVRQIPVIQQIKHEQKIQPKVTQNKAIQIKNEIKTQYKYETKNQLKPQNKLQGTRPESRLKNITIQTEVNREPKKQINTQLKEISEIQNKLIDKKHQPNSLSSTKRQERKAKTPFKRQNGRPQLFKSTEDIQHDISMDMSQKSQRLLAPGHSRKQIQIKSMSRQISKQFTTGQVAEKNQNIQNQKINIFRVQKRKIQSLPSKVQQMNQNLIDVKDYMDNVIRMKNDLLQNSISIGKQRQFILNAQLTVSQFPQKLQGQQILKNFRQNYDFLNYVNYNKDYEIKLHKGRSSLLEQKIKVESQMIKHKQKIKNSFLNQINKFVDYYVQRTIK